MLARGCSGERHPRKLEGSTDENGALTVPLSLRARPRNSTGNCRPIGVLHRFSHSDRVEPRRIKDPTRGAIKAVEAENRKKMDDKKKGNGPRPISTPPTTRHQRRSSRRATDLRSKVPNSRLKAKACSIIRRRRTMSRPRSRRGKPDRSQPQHPNASASSLDITLPRPRGRAPPVRWSKWFGAVPTPLTLCRSEFTVLFLWAFEHRQAEQGKQILWYVTNTAGGGPLYFSRWFF